MNMRKLLLLLVTMLLMRPVLMAQDEKFKALFLYNFTKHIEWPSEKQGGEFVIGVLGKSPITKELQTIAEKRVVGAGQKIDVHEMTLSDNFSDYHIIYITDKYSEHLESVINKTKGRGVLVITDKEGLASLASCINYVKVDGKQNFEICRRHVDSQGLKVSAQLMMLGIKVD